MSIETPFSNIIDLRNSLDDLLQDIHHLQVHGRPASASLAQAPLLQEWSHATLLSPCIVGEVKGHPLLGNRRRIHTSQLVVFDAQRGWARTWSRFYRLGSSLSDDRRH